MLAALAAVPTATETKATTAMTPTAVHLLKSLLT
jgi:hypothetical protein